MKRSASMAAVVNAAGRTASLLVTALLPPAARDSVAAHWKAKDQDLAVPFNLGAVPPPFASNQEVWAAEPVEPVETVESN